MEGFDQKGIETRLIEDRWTPEQARAIYEAAVAAPPPEPPVEEVGAPPEYDAVVPIIPEEADIEEIEERGY